MKATMLLSGAVLLASIALGSLAVGKEGTPPPASTYLPELEYLKAVNRVGPPKDPQVLFLLMAQYANANRHGEGAEFFSALLKEHEARLSERQKALYLAAEGLLRAGHANHVPLLKRIGWVRATIAKLEDAKRMSGGEVFVVRWMSGVVLAQLPGIFGQGNTALADLAWCLENADKAPHAGWLREVHYQLAASYDRNGDQAKARHHLQESGYPDFNKAITLTTPFGEDIPSGHTFSPRRIQQVVPGKVYVLSGFEFTEYYFVVSDDGRELIAIDAGTRPDSAQAAYEALRAYAPHLPELTAVLVTHSHWDHIGGHKYFRALNSGLKFYARVNYQEEIARDLSAPEPFFKRFFGSRFSIDDVRDFKADVLIERRSELRIGGTRIEFIPVQGGETDDALFIHLPDHGVMFVGDFIMPYLGAPFIEEGSLPGLIEAIDVVVKENPRHLLHGHEPLTRTFSSVPMLAALKTHLAWLNEQVLAAVKRGEERAALHRANLIPPQLLAGDPDAHLPYLVLRENVINRVYDQTAGYWQPDLQGLDALGRADRGSILVDYLGVSEKQIAGATARMIADGNHELAAATLDWTRDRFPASASLREAERLAYLKLKEKYQEFNPFKFILYSGKIGDPTPQMAR